MIEMQVATRRQRSTTSPAFQRHTRTSKPYLYVGVMEREKGSIRDGEESIGGGTPVAPNLPRAWGPGPGPSRPGPRPIQTRAHGSPGQPTRQQRIKTTPTPSFSQLPDYRRQQTPRGPRIRRCIEGPHTRAGPKRIHQPMLPAAQAQSAPRNPTAVRPPGRQPTFAGIGLPSSAVCSRQKNNNQEPPTPHPGQDRSPSAEPPQETHP
ncbi:hypothetical protein M9458_054556 [Cirrhinus mrigala]|uniref:Uncharacterized protein n=1 Tax=Cirrhinus mrigala TaxID=683832 RepID=A0ABD0MMH5_CIRMR